MSHLLDTNSVVDLLRKGQQSNVAVRMAATPPGSVFLCSVVIAELIYGAHRSGSAHRVKNLALVASVQRQFVSLPFDDDAANVYGAVRADLASKGSPIGPNDLLIASIALSRSLTLMTHNTLEFSRIPALKLEDWQ